MIYTDEEGRVRSDWGVSEYVSINKPYRPKDPSKTLPKQGKFTSQGIEKFPDKKNSYSKRKTKLFETKCNCKECNNQTIFYCKCENGGRVFFETLYPTWDKHKCPCYSDNEYIEKMNSIDNKIFFRILHPEFYNRRKSIFKYTKNEGLKDFELKITNSNLYSDIKESKINILYSIQSDKTIYLKVLDRHYKELVTEITSVDKFQKCFQSILNKLDLPKYKIRKNNNKQKHKHRKQENFNSVFQDYFKYR
jgi:hypothetical protein